MRLLKGSKNKRGGLGMGEELKKILNMVEEGIITADEAESLIRAMDDEGSNTNFSEEDRGRRNRFIRIRVSEGGESKVNINIPLSLVDIATKVGTKFIPYDEIPNGEDLKDIDWDEIVAAIKEGTSGKIVDIQDGGDSVEIYVE